MAVVEDICPSCARRPIEDEESGFCGRCAGAEYVQEYFERELPKIEARREGWRDRSAVALRERQRRSRLYRETRPREPARAGIDPLELALEALHLLSRVRAHMATMFEADGSYPPDHVDAAAEIVRRLAWGPEAEHRPVRARPARRRVPGASTSHPWRSRALPTGTTFPGHRSPEKPRNHKVVVTAPDRVLAALRAANGPTTIADLAAELGMNPNTTAAAVRKLGRENLARVVVHGGQRVANRWSALA